jgi:hypothetical protein
VLVQRHRNDSELLSDPAPAGSGPIGSSTAPQEDFLESGERYDLIFELAGTRSPGELRRALMPRATLVLSSGDSNGRWIGPVIRILKAAALNPFVTQRISPFLAKSTPGDLEILKELIEAGKVRPVSSAPTH